MSVGGRVEAIGEVRFLRRVVRCCRNLRDARHRTQDEKSPLACAAAAGQVGVAERLLKGGAAVNGPSVRLQRLCSLAETVCC